MKSLIKTEVVLKLANVRQQLQEYWKFNKNRSCIEIFLDTVTDRRQLRLIKTEVVLK